MVERVSAAGGAAASEVILTTRVSTATVERV